MSSTDNRRLVNTAAALLLLMAFSVWIYRLFWAWREPLSCDDAYMFARYANNIRHGLGMSWNLDGVHTYGQTSLLWSFVVLVLSFLPIATWKMLTLGSLLCSIGAVVAIAWAVAANAKSQFFSSTWRILPLVAAPLFCTSSFVRNAGNGMETMLSVLLVAVFAGLALQWSRAAAHPETVSLVAIALLLTRPDAAIVIFAFPVLLFLLMPGVGMTSLVRLLAVVCIGIAVDLIACKLYFHTPLPLSFYMKSGHAYEGYRAEWHPGLLMLGFFSGCVVYLLMLVLLARKQDVRLIVCCVTPALLTFAYLQTVTQIMGQYSRYYVPYFAFFILPSLLVLDRRLSAGDVRWPRSPRRLGVAAVVALCCFVFASSKLVAKFRRATATGHFEYDPVHFDIAAKTPLPVLKWAQGMTAVTDLLVAPLPRGATVAATEVGYLGVKAPHVNIIDLAGLNDTQIALHGFNMQALLARKPDILWMPNLEYTYQSGLMLSDPALLQQYELYAGAANYGLAIRKDSPYRAQIDAQMPAFWNSLYPHSNSSDYLVHSASWSGQKHIVIKRY